MNTAEKILQVGIEYIPFVSMDIGIGDDAPARLKGMRDIDRQPPLLPAPQAVLLQPSGPKIAAGFSSRL